MKLPVLLRLLTDRIVFAKIKIEAFHNNTDACSVAFHKEGMKMRLHTKRKIAVLMDYFVIGSIFALIFGFVDEPDWYWSFSFTLFGASVQLPSVGVLPILGFVFGKDLLFRNASLGKKLMGLAVLDQSGNMPTVRAVLKRGCVMQTLGYVTFIRYCFTKDDIAQWEMQALGTRVVCKKT